MTNKSSGHGRHLYATQRVLTKQIEEIRRAVVHGQSHGQDGRSLSPLPAEAWNIVLPFLENFDRKADEIARRNMSGALRESLTPQTAEATFRWVSLMLNRLEESLAELDPKGIENRFGAFDDPAEPQRIEAELTELRAQWRAAIDGLSSWRSKQP